MKKQKKTTLYLSPEPCITWMDFGTYHIGMTSKRLKVQECSRQNYWSQLFLHPYMHALCRVILKLLLHKGWCECPHPLTFYLTMWLGLAKEMLVGTRHVVTYWSLFSILPSLIGNRPLLIPKEWELFGAEISPLSCNIKQLTQLPQIHEQEINVYSCVTLRFWGC